MPDFCPVVCKLIEFSNSIHRFLKNQFFDNLRMILRPDVRMRAGT